MTSGGQFDRRTFLGLCLGAASVPTWAAFAKVPPGVDHPHHERLRRLWDTPPSDCRPRTRWWWPGNAVTREGIETQLRDMQAHGIGGVQIVSIWQVYERGNHDYLSPEWAALLCHALDCAAALGLDVSLAFGPGWDVGGSWVPPQDRSKVLAPAYLDVDGPTDLDAVLPRYSQAAPTTGLYANLFTPEATDDHERVLAVVAARLVGNTLVAETLIDLTPRLLGHRLHASLPEGRWRVFAFRMMYTGQRCAAQDFQPPHWVVDHLDRNALQRACTHLADTLRNTCGPHLGRTVTSLFFDSFEVIPLPDTVLWSRDTLAGFARHAGYDLTRLLPALWWDIGPETRRVRYDVNAYLHQVALDGAYTVFTRTAEDLGLQACIQPHYRFTAETIEGAGRAHRPETEVTTARFATVADPRKATVAGARFYGRRIVSAEAYTFIHRERYRATLEELKIATDAFLRDGVTLFYNHGYLYSPEPDVAPDRDFEAAERIQPWNPWWPYYPHLARYIARCCALLREGRFCADVLLYSPQAQVWTERVVRNVEQRVMPYGDLPQTLLANGYDYDIVNDDVLRHHARFGDGRVHIRDQAYRTIILPAIRALPVETMKALQAFVLSGGVLLAVGTTPSEATGAASGQAGDAEVCRIVDELFGPDGNGREHAGGGCTYGLADYVLPHVPFSPQRQEYTPSRPLQPGPRRLLQVLRTHVPPDVVLAGGRQSDGLTFQHRRVGDVDLYFIANLQPVAVDEWIGVRAASDHVARWDPTTGQQASLVSRRRRGEYVDVRLQLGPWGSCFLVFVPESNTGGPATRGVHVVDSTGFDAVNAGPDGEVLGIASRGGHVALTFQRGARRDSWHGRAAAPPPPLFIEGPWQLTVEGVRIPRLSMTLNRLVSWTDHEALRHVSGVGTYTIDVDLPDTYLADDLALELDLGMVGHVAEVVFNTDPVGVCWMQPYRLPLGGRRRVGRQRLEIRVTNTLIHHVTGLQALPAIPADVAAHHGTAPRAVRRIVEAASRDRAVTGLPACGLIGPVVIRARRRVRVPTTGARP